jgi:prevent-host-death family protein
MREIGITELRHQARRHLRDVQRGETIQVTDRGRPVARLVPIARTGGIDRLVASGRLVPPSGDALALGAPLEPAPGVALPSELLGRARAGAR